MSTFTINIPFEISHDAASGFTYCTDPNLGLSVYASSVNAAKAKLRSQIEARLQEVLTSDKNYSRRVFGCHSGEVLIVSYRNNAWGYDMAGEGRAHCASCQGFKSFEEACEKARDHASQVWGGVKWEC